MWDIVSARRCMVKCRGNSTLIVSMLAVVGRTYKYRMSHSQQSPGLVWAGPVHLPTPMVARYGRALAARSGWRAFWHLRTPGGRINGRSILFGVETAYLQEDLSVYPIRLFPKNRTENHRHLVVISFDVDSLLIPIMYRHDLPTLSQTLRR